MRRITPIHVARTARPSIALLPRFSKAHPLNGIPVPADLGRDGRLHADLLHGELSHCVPQVRSVLQGGLAAHPFIMSRVLLGVHLTYRRIEAAPTEFKVAVRAFFPEQVSLEGGVEGKIFREPHLIGEPTTLLAPWNDPAVQRRMEGRAQLEIAQLLNTQALCARVNPGETHDYYFYVPLHGEAKDMAKPALRTVTNPAHDISVALEGAREKLAAHIRRVFADHPFVSDEVLIEVTVRPQHDNHAEYLYVSFEVWHPHEIANVPAIGVRHGRALTVVEQKTGSHWSDGVQKSARRRAARQEMELVLRDALSFTPPQTFGRWLTVRLTRKER